MPAEAGRARLRPALEPAEALRVEEITEPDELEALRPEWSSLFDADPEASPFQSPEWLLAWRRAFLTHGGLLAVAARSAGELVGLAPFFIHVLADGRRQLTLLGNGISDRQDLLARPEARAAVGRAVGDWLAQRAPLWDVADFRDLPQGAALLALPLGGTDQIDPEEPCPTLPLPAEPEAVRAALPRSRRTDLARCARRLGEIAPLSFGRADAASRREHLDALIALHGARWRARGKRGVFAEGAVLGFHEEATAGLMACGLLQFESLRLGPRIIAVHYMLRRGARGYSYLHAFDPEFAGFGPGWLLMACSLERAVREGVRSFDFLRGREAYKYAWGAIDHPQWRRRVWR